MKRNFIKAGTVALTALAISTVLASPYISHSESNDPLVSVSYLNDVILPQFKQDILAEFTKNGIESEDYVDSTPEVIPEVTVPEEVVIPEVTEPVATAPVTPEASQEDTTATDVVEENTVTVPSTYTLLELEYGKCIYTNSVLEFIARPGSQVAVISPFAEQGAADITNGKEYLNGDIVINNAYCLIPRGSDGRGLQVMNEKSYILVRGEYYIG